METSNHTQEALLMEWLHLEDDSSDVSDHALHALLSESRMTVRAGFKEEILEALPLQVFFRESRVPVREGFKESVMEALPAPAWRKAPVRFALPVAAMVFFSLGAMALFSGAAAGEGHVFATGGAVLDLFTAALMAGAGLFTASWSGLGAAVGGLFTADAGSLVGFGVLVLFANLLFFSLLRRRRVATESASDDH